MIRIVREVHLQADQQDRYIPAPFEVPTGIERLFVRCEYPQAHDCVIDIGCLEGDRFRGWSGGARREFFIAPAKATPGYLPGRVEPGSWAILLGTYRVPPEGCTVRLEIELTPRRGRWVKGDLHHHSHHSDGAFSVREAVGYAEVAGLDFLALTDHNTISHNSFLGIETPLLLIPGMEVTTNHGHANILGISKWVDFRWRSTGALEVPFQVIHEQGGLVTLNHPECEFCPWEWDRDFAFDLVEVWNGTWAPRNERAVNWWDRQLKTGRRLPAVGGSDMHRFAPGLPLRTGTPTTHVWVDELTVEALMAGLKTGAAWVSCVPQGPRLVVQTKVGDRMATVEGGAGGILRFVTARSVYEMTVPAGESFTTALPVPEGYVRAELRGADGVMLALTNALYE
jgi:hypothetical protein